MKVTALADTVIVRPEKVEQTRDSGLVIPDAAQDRPTRGHVVSSGAKAAVKPGDMVVFSRYAGQDFELDLERLIILKSHDILAVLDVH